MLMNLFKSLKNNSNFAARYFIFSLVILVLLNLSQCVTLADFEKGRPVEIQKTILGNSYSQNGTIIDYDDLAGKLDDYPVSHKNITAFYALYYPSLILGGIGGGLLGWNLGTAMYSPSPDWTLAYIGAGSMALGLVLTIIADHQLETAVNNYNATLPSSMAGSRKKVSLILDSYQRSFELDRNSSETFVAMGLKTFFR